MGIIISSTSPPPVALARFGLTKLHFIQRSLSPDVLRYLQSIELVAVPEEHLCMLGFQREVQCRCISMDLIITVTRSRPPLAGRLHGHSGSHLLRGPLSLHSHQLPYHRTSRAIRSICSETCGLSTNSQFLRCPSSS